MKKTEIIVMVFLFVVSTIYAYKKPDKQIENINNKIEIIINVEGLYRKELKFNHNPSIKEILMELKLSNKFNFEETLILTNKESLYIPLKDNLVSLNKADINTLCQIKGIKKKMANKIIEYRNKNRFKRIEDLKQIKGIGEKTYLKYREYFSL